MLAPFWHTNSWILCPTGWGQHMVQMIWKLQFGYWYQTIKSLPPYHDCYHKLHTISVTCASYMLSWGPPLKTSVWRVWSSAGAEYPKGLALGQKWNIWKTIEKKRCVVSVNRLMFYCWWFRIIYVDLWHCTVYISVLWSIHLLGDSVVPKDLDES